MTDDASPPATKDDVAHLLEGMKQIYDQFDRTKQDLQDMEERLMRHVDVRMEELRGDLFGATDDRFASLDHRLTRVEQKVGA